MALKVGPCARCNGDTSRHWSFVDGEGWVCDPCKPIFDVSFYAYPAQDLTTFAIIRATVRGYATCSTCGYSWGSYASSRVTFDELLKNGITKPFINAILDCGHPLIEQHKRIAEAKALAHFRKEMPVCDKCRKPEVTE